MIFKLSLFIILSLQYQEYSAVQPQYHTLKETQFSSYHPASSSYSHFLQPNDVDSGKYDLPNHVTTNLCARPCEGSSPKICYWKFHLEAYNTLTPACGNCTRKGVCTTPHAPQCITGDGYERSVLVVNRRMTGPSIQVCKGDTIVVDVINLLPGRSTTIHWHGLPQTLTPHMDGVPMVTQCPILEDNEFRYKFLADAAGTYFWHSHDGFQKMDGIIGSLIIRQPKIQDPNGQYYDYDHPSHVITITDWFHNTTGDQRWPGLRLHDTEMLPDTFLLNGRGSYPGFHAPYAEFIVKPNKRYRFRFIAGTCLVCPFQVSIESHPLTLVSMDKSSVEPVKVDAYTAVAGERYDFVIETSNPASSYWIHVKGVGPCEETKPFQLGILKYEGSYHAKPPSRNPGYKGFPIKQIFNAPNADCNPKNLTNICISHLAGKEPIRPGILDKEPDVRILLAPGFHEFKYEEVFNNNEYIRYFMPVPDALPLTALINNISNRFPSSPLISQYHDIPKDELCSPSCVVDSFPKVCTCTNVVRLPKNKVVEIVVADATGVGLTHPMHLHGYCYYILAQGVFPKNIPFHEAIAYINKDLNDGRQIRPKPPMKDTLPLPASGYFVTRIYTDNPGFWFFHCHFLYHHQTGMSAIVQVGDLSDMVSTPHDFPRCGNFYND